MTPDGRWKSDYVCWACKEDDDAGTYHWVTFKSGNFNTAQYHDEALHQIRLCEACHRDMIEARFPTVVPKERLLRIPSILKRMAINRLKGG